MNKLAVVLVASTVLIWAHGDSSQAQQLGTKIYWMATVNVPIGKLAEYHTFLEKELMPLQGKHGYRYVAVWQTIVGNIEQVVALAEFENMAAYHKARVSLLASSEWKATSAKFDTLTTGQHTRFLSAALYSPMK